MSQKRQALYLCSHAKSLGTGLQLLRGIMKSERFFIPCCKTSAMQHLDFQRMELTRMILNESPEQEIAQKKERLVELDKVEALRLNSQCLDKRPAFFYGQPGINTELILSSYPETIRDKVKAMSEQAPGPERPAPTITVDEIVALHGRPM